MRIITEQTEETKPSRNVRREKRRWDDEALHSLSMGCMGCTDLDKCGGENKRQAGMSCNDDCCGNPAACQTMCPRNPTLFLQMMREIDGFGLANIARAAPRPAAPLPAYVPLFYHCSNRPDPLDLEAVAVPLHKVYGKRDGRLRFNTGAELREAFGVTDTTRVILIGSGRDQPLENWWGLSDQRREVLAGLARLGVELITSPNYSLFTDVPRHDNLRNIKRIGIAWQEIVSAGIPGGLHLNARTVRDYSRFIEFIGERSEVTDLAFEFRTVWRERRNFHVWHLSRLGRSIDRPLNLTLVGGLRTLKTLAPAFAKVTYIDTHAFMTATHRQRLIEGNDGKLTKVLLRTMPGEPISPLVEDNIRVMRGHVDRLLSEALATRQAANNESMPKSPGKAASARAARR